MAAHIYLTTTLSQQLFLISNISYFSISLSPASHKIISLILIPIFQLPVSYFPSPSFRSPASSSNANSRFPASHLPTFSPTASRPQIPISCFPSPISQLSILCFSPPHALSILCFLSLYSQFPASHPQLLISCFLSPHSRSLLQSSYYRSPASHLPTIDFLLPTSHLSVP
jgi:hypothetical protein